MASLDLLSTDLIIFPQGHIQVAQPPKRIEPSGPGEIQYQYIFNLLKELGYKGWIGLEYSPSGI